MTQSCSDHSLGQAFSRIGADVTANQLNPRPPFGRDLSQRTEDSGNSAAHDQNSYEIRKSSNRPPEQRKEGKAGLPFWNNALQLRAIGHDAAAMNEII
jgi:hypothetical protein